VIRGGFALAGLLLALLAPVPAGAAVLAPADRAEPLLAATGGPGPVGPAPSNVAVDDEGDVYVTDYAGDRVLKFSPDGAVLGEWGGHGAGPGQFSGPFGVTLDQRNAIYVVDQLNGRIQKFSPEGVFLAAWGGAGAAGGQLRTPFGAASVPRGVYVADFGNDRVLLFAHDGRLVRRWGGRGGGAGQFTRPAAVAVDPEGNVYVSDHFNNRVQKFSAEGRFLAQVGSVGPDAGAPQPTADPPAAPPDAQLLRPEGLAVDRAGNVYVADYGRDRVAKFSPDGQLVTAWGTRGAAPGEFVGPKGVAVDRRSGPVYVADTGNGRVQRFSLDGAFETSWTLPAT
jgi:DNA-binding beta-propeller fold protein YncE